MADANGDLQLQEINPHNNSAFAESELPSYKESQSSNETIISKTAGCSNPSYIPDRDESAVVVPNDLGTTFNKGKDIQHNTKESKQDADVEQYEEESDDDEDYDTKFAKSVASGRRAIRTTYSKHKTILWASFWILLACLYFAYFGYAMYLTFDVNDEGAMRLLVVTILVSLFIMIRLLWRHCMQGVNVTSFCTSENPTIKKIHKGIYWFLVIATGIFIVAFVVVDIALKQPSNLISAIGLVAFQLIFFVFSKNPAKVSFRPVFWGLALQFYFALLILRTEEGFQAFNWLGDRVREFLAYTDAGAQFVFGQDFRHHFFAFSALENRFVTMYAGYTTIFLRICFMNLLETQSINQGTRKLQWQVLSVVVFFSSVVSVLYYLGVMQFIIRHIAKFLAFCLGTSPTESLNAAGNIFLGQSESPLMIRPFVKDMTRSEIHAVCTGGFATVAGSTMAAYILMGVPANHLLSASVMSAPAALAMSKLLYPETKKSKADADKVYAMQKGTESNIIEAASNGASVAIRLVANIAVNLIAFLAILQFLDQTLIWFGHRVNMNDPELTFRFVCSYVFFPISWLLGTSLTDVRKVAGLIGTKTFLNEFVAYAELGEFIKNTNKYNEYMRNTTGLSNGTTYTREDIILNYSGEILKGGILTIQNVEKELFLRFYMDSVAVHIGTYKIASASLLSGQQINMKKQPLLKVKSLLVEAYPRPSPYCLRHYVRLAHNPKDRSTVISTYALCGFSNIGSLGIMLGALGGMAPTRKKDITKVLVRAMIAGNVACFMTACIAGLLYEEKI